ncbi:bifunctional indole-3-glycerol phosphate synthase/phosphoribosylanthranilate isomerase [Rodentibacter rarus]|uniref:Multifunctional fusion protein n=1 Tax=Rodentibacter rarus TaxID=1908260 RepID=A0A1V3IPT3_9PAST|nr:bifunctional indole-3-glycerol-phosphate synthase TrpC/phosphoribosylanthranilate isomerase TrpF [Rodentibacter rarus]OOF38592.1 bifunctional indole-3-glycerol phosphate synthase/phosphoribosylanthranilate isomerase [Rodentibacter rarus]OOF44193.1 bifunctional indole-3-glycerol phosphate synthase/phosphoribosylanthranilate isomerase [Rodentibacter rarus]
MITQDFSKPIASATVLQKIVLDKAAWVKAKEAEFPLSKFQQNLTKSDRSFYDALSKGSHQKPAYILECKKASPSKGLIRSEFNLDEIANVYKHYASAVSVLTDEKYFQGDFEFLPQVRNIVPQPVLCKDFMISEYQVYLARYYQADAILLMLSVVNDDTYQVLANLAHSLGMGVLTETSNEEEFERALALGAKIIGVNNRNLHDLSVDLNRVVQLTEKYADRIPSEVRIISESGIYDHQQIRQLQKVAQGFLIGSSLMGSTDLNNAVRTVIFGENKVCGLTRIQDVKTVYENGALYGGLIFAEKSKRCISLRQAQELVTAAPLRFVGVFQNQDIDFILKIAQQLSLYAVQLHGSETPEFITDLRRKLPEHCQIWKALSIDIHEKSAVDFSDDFHVARYIFDSQTANQQGGIGKAFDWSLIPEKLKYKTILAGGISAENVEQAIIQGCLGVDLNSGVESMPGIKNEEKVRSVFEKIFDLH